MEKNKEQELEIIEQEEKVVEPEVVEVEQEVIETPVSEEVEIIEHEVDVTIEEETYVEYFKSIAFKSQLKPTLFFGVVVVLLSYFFRGEDVAATEALLRGLMWGAIFIVVSIGVSFFTMPSRAKSTYAKSGIRGLVLHTAFTNIGVKQSIEDQSVTYKWEDIDHFIESDHSFYGHMLKLRKIVLMSKKNMTEEDVKKIEEIIVSHLGESKLVPLNKKK